MNVIGYFHGIDPAASLVRDGEIVAYVEEERLIRFKHANGIFPLRAIESCLRIGGITLDEVDYVAYGWDVPRYTDGGIEAFYRDLNQRIVPDDGTRAWQKRNLSWFSRDSLEARFRSAVVPHFGIPPEKVPPHRYFPHHKSHAAASFYYSPFEEALVLILDGSGDSECTTVWHGRGTELSLLHNIQLPHSLGWFYAAMTEYLGFQAYDGEYKVMGLAAYGKEHLGFREKLEQVVHAGPGGFDYVVEPKYIHHGPHSFSHRFTDHLVELLDLPPRQGARQLEAIHESLAYEVQRALETTVERLAKHVCAETGIRRLCIGGGVGLNVKLNSRLHRCEAFDGVFAFPMPSDSATGMGAAVGLHVEQTGSRPQPLEHVYYGPSYTDEEIGTQIRTCGLPYRKCRDIAEDTAELLARGKVVAWYQTRMEGGPRALGARSILADPRDVASRDRVNSAIKFREYWRPFCPSMTEEAAQRFLKRGEAAPYMILAFEATDESKEKVPAVVHVDGTMRAQTVTEASNPRYYRLLKAFEERTGVPVVLNTSFNIKGEAIVCSPRDAFRTFWSTGIDALAIGPFLIEKPEPPVAATPESYIR